MSRQIYDQLLTIVHILDERVGVEKGSDIA